MTGTEVATMPNGFASLPPAVRQLLLAAVCLIGFAFVADQVTNRNSLVEFDVLQADRLYLFAHAHPAVRQIALNITDLGSGRWRTYVVVTVAVVLLLDRQCKWALAWSAGQWLVPTLVSFAKGYFARPRPDYPEVQLLAGGWAFPSGHALGAMATYAMLAYLVAWNWPERWFRWLISVVLAAIILGVGFSRMLLGVHWFSDVLGGYLLGLAYVSIWIALMEALPIARHKTSSGRALQSISPFTR